MFPPFYRNRGLFGAPPTESVQQTGNPVFDQFIQTVLPLIQQRNRLERINQVRDTQSARSFESGEREKDRNLQRELRAPRIEQIASGVPPATQGPMNTVFRDFIDPYRQALLEQGSRRLDIQEDQGEKKTDLAKFREEEIIRKNKATEKTKEDELKRKTTADERSYELAKKRNAIAQMNVDLKMPEEDKIKLQAMLRGELINLQGDNTIEAENLRGTIREKLARITGEETRKTAIVRGDESRKTIESKPETPFQVNQRIKNKYLELRVTRPDLAGLITINPNDNTMEIDEDTTDEQRKEIMKLLIESGPVKSTKPAVNNDPGGLFTPKK